MSASKKKGTAWESAIVELLRGNGAPYAERRTLNGTRDCGDVAGIPGVVIEAKADKSISPAAALREAEAERANAAASIGVVWAKTIGKAKAADGVVYMTPATFLRLLQEAGYLGAMEVTR